MAIRQREDESLWRLIATSMTKGILILQYIKGLPQAQSYTPSVSLLVNLPSVGNNL